MKPLNSSNFDARFDAKDFSSSIIFGLAQGSGEYFTRLGVGTPPRYTYMVLDTGSDIMWIQCLPCSKCYTQTDSFFNPATSSTYRKVPCERPPCKKLDISGRYRSGRYCEYQVSYGDGSFTVGDFSTETLTFRGQVVNKVALGCGHDNEGLFVGVAGLLGLGHGALSFPSQTNAQFNKRFSYCLVDSSAAGTTSSLIFGSSAIPRSAFFTPLLSNPKLDTFYYLELVAISVRGKRLTSIPTSVFRMDATSNAGVIIDSGTSVTRLVQSAYTTMRDAFRAGTAKLKSAGCKEICSFLLRTDFMHIYREHNKEADSLSVSAGRSFSDVMQISFGGVSFTRVINAGSRYERNLKSLLGIFIRQASDAQDYSNASEGSGEDAIVGFYHCTGHLEKQDCANCIQKAISLISHTCLRSCEVLFDLDGCLLRYGKITSSNETGNSFIYNICSGTLSSDNNLINNLKTALSNLMINCSSFKRDGCGLSLDVKTGSVHGFAKCKADISDTDCNNCTSAAAQRLKNVCGASVSGQVYLSNCFVGYERN